MPMHGLENLIRLHEWTVDERRRELGILLRDLEKLETALETLLADLAAEQTLAAADPEGLGRTYGAYYNKVKEQQKMIETAMVTKEHEILAARENLNAAYMDLKKYEVAQDLRKKAAAAEESRREQAELDELGLEQYRRRQKAG